MTVGERLRRAIEDGPRSMSVRGFQREMEARLKDTGVRGYTYPSINSYLHDETSPSVAFLEHAADVLGVRLAYLAAGHAPMVGPSDDSFRAGWDAAMERVRQNTRDALP